jgi:hypothetical protein
LKPWKTGDFTGVWKAIGFESHFLVPLKTSPDLNPIKVPIDIPRRTRSRAVFHRQRFDIVAMAVAICVKVDNSGFHLGWEMVMDWI